MPKKANGWPELTYRYVEHYFWEPQHLLLTTGSSERAAAKGDERVQAVQKRLRRQEVPLNFLLNVLLRIVPATIRTTSLTPFGIDVSRPGLASLTLCTPGEYKLTHPEVRVQPDIHLESAEAIVFIEMKVEATLTLAQIRKYVRLISMLNTACKRPKDGYVLLLVKPNELRLSDVKTNFAHEDGGRGLSKLLGDEANGVHFGSTNWQSFGRNLELELEQRATRSDESSEMLSVLLGDFLSDLRTRRLLQAGRPRKT